MGAFNTWLNLRASKSTPVDADETYLRDSEASGASKKLTWANIKATLKAYFDTLYQSSTAPGSTAQVLFNSAGAFAASSGLSWDNSAKKLSIATTDGSGTVLALQSSYGSSWLAVGGSGSLTWNGGRLGSNGGLWAGYDSSTLGFGNSIDLILARDAADSLAQRRGTNAQTFRLYNTYTDASNYERGFVRFNGGVFEVGPEAAGTGTQPQMRVPLGTVTTSKPLEVTQTWNNAAVTFTGLKFDATDTASAAASKLFDLQVGGAGRLSVSKTGLVTSENGPHSAVFGSNGTEAYYEVQYSGQPRSALQQSGLRNNADGQVSWSSSGTNHAASRDLILARDAAGTLAQRSGTNAQTWRTYGTYTDASNYRRVAIAMTTAGVASIAPEGAGTGASGNVLHISGLPTSNPGAGILWNDGGTVKVGT